MTDATELTVSLEDATHIGFKDAYEWMLAKVRKRMMEETLDADWGWLKVLSIKPEAPDADIRLSNRTLMRVTAKKHRVVFLLDCSRSMQCLGFKGTLQDDAIFCCQQMLKHLYQEINIYCSYSKETKTLIPEIKVSVLALLGGTTALTVSDGSHKRYVYPLVQNYSLVDIHDYNAIICHMRKRLDQLAGEFRKTNTRPNSRSLNTSDYDIASWLNIGSIALEFMPKDHIASLCILTDGVISLQNQSFFHDEIVKLKQSFVAFSIIRLKAESPVYGLLHDDELLKYTTGSLDGTFLMSEQIGRLDDWRNGFSFAQQILLFRNLSLSQDYKIFRGLSEYFSLEVQTVREMQPGPYDSRDHVYVLFKDYNIQVPWSVIYSERLRRGFSIHSLSISEGLEEVTRKQIRLHFNWHPSVCVEYRLRSTSDIDAKQNHTHIRDQCRLEIGLRSSPDFANYFLSSIKQLGLTAPRLSSSTASYRKKAEALLIFLKSLADEDDELRDVYAYILNANLNRMPHEFAIHDVDDFKAIEQYPDDKLRNYWLGIRDRMKSTARVVGLDLITFQCINANSNEYLHPLLERMMTFGAVFHLDASVYTVVINTNSYALLSVRKSKFAFLRLEVYFLNCSANFQKDFTRSIKDACQLNLIFPSISMVAFIDELLKDSDANIMGFYEAVNISHEFDEPVDYNYLQTIWNAIIEKKKNNSIIVTNNHDGTYIVLIRQDEGWISICTLNAVRRSISCTVCFLQSQTCSETVQKELHDQELFMSSMDAFYSMQRNNADDTLEYRQIECCLFSIWPAMTKSKVNFQISIDGDGGDILEKDCSCLDKLVDNVRESIIYMLPQLPKNLCIAVSLLAYLEAEIEAMSAAIIKNKAGSKSVGSIFGDGYPAAQEPRFFLLKSKLKGGLGVVLFPNYLQTVKQVVASSANIQPFQLYLASCSQQSLLDFYVSSSVKATGDQGNVTCEYVNSLNNAVARSNIKLNFMKALIDLSGKECLKSTTFDLFRELIFEVDITTLSNTIHRLFVSDDEKLSIAQKFDRVIEKYFAVYQENGSETLFFLRPSREDVSVEDCFIEAEVPVFLRLEFSVRQIEEGVAFESGEAVTERWATINVHSLPTSYFLETTEGKKSFVPENINELDSPSTGQQHGQLCYLRLVYIILDSESHLDSDASATDEGMPLRATQMISQLPQDKRTRLTEMESAIDVLLKQELLRLLLRWKPISSQILDLVYSVFSQSSKQLDCCSILDIPIQFIRPEQGRVLLLDHVVDFQGEIGFTRIGRYYLAIPANCDSESPLAYWLILSLEFTFFHVMCFAPSMSSEARMELMQKVSFELEKQTRRINQMSLLRELNETRLCSKYLVVPDDKETEFDEDEYDELPKDPRIHPKINIGEFQCDLVGRWSFPLHWRFKPGQILNQISSNVLHSLSVTNRKHMFVYAAGSNIFYMRLLESSYVEESSKESSTKLSSPSTSMENLFAFAKDDIGSVPGVYNITRKENSRLAVDSNMLFLETYGIENPPKSIMDEFISLIENKIISATVVILSSFLVRSVSPKLSQADSDFLVPLNKSPLGVLTIGIPNIVELPAILILLLKQTLSQSCININSAELSESIKRNIITRYKNAFNSVSSVDSIVIPSVSASLKNLETGPGEYVFIYNSVAPKALNTQEFFAGQGIAVISLVIKDSNDQIVHSLPCPLFAFSSDSPLGSDYIAQVLSSNMDEMTSECYLKFQFELWSVGNVQVDILFDKTRTAFYQSVADYFFETTFAYIRKSFRGSTVGSDLSSTQISPLISDLLQSNLVRLLNKVFKSDNRPDMADKLGSCILISSSVYIPAWSMSSLIEWIQTELLQLHDSLIPKVFDYDEGNGFDSQKHISKLSYHRVLVAGLFEDSPWFNETGEGNGSDYSALHSLVTPIQQESTTISSASRTPKPLNSHGRSNYEALMEKCSISGNYFEEGISKKIEIHYSCGFVIVALPHRGLDCYLYNVNPGAVESFRSKLQNRLNLISKRFELINVTVEQKLGIFFEEKSNKCKIQDDEDIYPIFNLKKSDTSDNNDFNNLTWKQYRKVLHDSCNDTFDFETEPENDMDFITHFSGQLLKLHTKIAKNKVQQENIEKVYGLWRSNEKKIAQDLSSPSELLCFLRHLRLYHWCRTPILFSPLRDSLFLLTGGTYICTYSELTSKYTDPRDYHSFPDESAARRWFEELTSTFLSSYVTYLKSLGMNIVLTVDRKSSIAKFSGILSFPKFTLSRDLSVETDVYILQKALQGGVILVETRLQDMLASVNVYTANQPDRESDENSNSSQSYLTFTDECAKFKNLIHVNSFVYDFHLRYIIMVLCYRTRLVKWLDFLDILRAIHRYNITSANFSKNRLFKSTFQTKCEMSGDEMLKYISRNWKQFGFRNIELKGRITASYITNSNPNFTNNTVSSGDCVYALIVFPFEPENNSKTTPSISGELRISYFVVAANIRDTFPKDNQSDVVLFDEQLSILKDQVQLRLERAKEQALRYYGRDALWRRLVALPSLAAGEQSQLTIDDFLVLSTRYSTAALAKYDPELNAIWSMNIAWGSMLDYLLSSYSDLAREFNEENGVRHLILLNPQDSDLLLHLTVDSERNSIQAEAVSREILETTDSEERNERINAVEQEFISEIIRAISFYVWKLSTDYDIV